MPMERSMIFWLSLVSTKSQIMARIDTNGRDASRAAMGENRFPSSETPAIIRPERMIFMRYCMECILAYAFAPCRGGLDALLVRKSAKSI